MKRDMDLAREILRWIENQQTVGRLPELTIEGHSPEEISYHVMLLDEAKLIEAINFSSAAGLKWGPKRLTWTGHEFLEASRNDTLWEKAKAKVASGVGGLAFEVLKGVLIQLAKEAVAAPLKS